MAQHLLLQLGSSSGILFNLNQVDGTQDGGGMIVVRLRSWYFDLSKKGSFVRKVFDVNIVKA